MKKPPGVLTRTPGRGVETHKNHRFSNLRLELDFNIFDQLEESERSLLKMEFFRDSSHTILTENESPDLCFKYSINFYRGCEHDWYRKEKVLSFLKDLRGNKLYNSVIFLV